VQPGSPGGVEVSPEVLAWTREARIHVRRNWVVPPAFEMQSLVTTIDVDLDAAGNVRGTPSVRQRSGNPWYDENVVRSIQKASPLPAPPDSGTWPFTFYSDRE
jgi:TonB family protein